VIEHQCEICGELAVQFTRDMVEAESGQWESGPVHHRCALHRRTAKTTYQDGSSSGGIDLGEGQEVPISPVTAELMTTMRMLRDAEVG